MILLARQRDGVEDATGGLRFVQHVKMDAGHAVIDQFLHLADCEFNACFELRRIIVLVGQTTYKLLRESVRRRGT